MNNYDSSKYNSDSESKNIYDRIMSIIKEEDEKFNYIIDTLIQRFSNIKSHTKVLKVQSSLKKRRTFNISE